MAMRRRSRKAARKGISGDRQVHAMRQRPFETLAIKPPKAGRSIAHAAINPEIFNRQVGEVHLPVFGNLALDVKSVEATEPPAEVAEEPQIRLATDDGHNLIDDEKRYQQWLELNTPIKAKVHPLLGRGKPSLRVVVKKSPVLTIGGVQFPGLTGNCMSYQWYSSSWEISRQRGEKALKNSRQQRNARVQGKVKDFLQVHRKPMPVAKNDEKVHIPWGDPQVILHPPFDTNHQQHRVRQKYFASKRRKLYASLRHKPKVKAPEKAPVAVSEGYMEKIGQIRRLRNIVAQGSHWFRDSGFMADVADKQLARRKYAKRLKLVRNRIAKRNAKCSARAAAELANKSLAMDQYRQRVLLRQFLKQHGEDMSSVRKHVVSRIDTAPVKMTKEEVTLAAFAAQYNDIVSRPVPPAPSNEEKYAGCIIKRAELKVRRETNAFNERVAAMREASRMSAWKYQMFNRECSPIEEIFADLREPVEVSLNSTQWVRTQATRAACEMVANGIIAESQSVVVDPGIEAEMWNTLNDGYLKLTRSGSYTQRVQDTLLNSVHQAAKSLGFSYDENRGLILPSRVLENAPPAKA